MTNYKKEIWNKAKTKGVIITRRKISDGYNYYLMPLFTNSMKMLVIDENFKYKEDITSETNAVKIAKNYTK